MGHLGLAAAGDSWVARQPDTRQCARQWLERFLPPGAGLLADLPAGAGPVVEAALEVPAGPLRLEVVLEAGEGGWPVVEQVSITPDLAAEFSCRWSLLKERLPILAGLEPGDS
ncbi:MAG: hypothetical protein HY910_06310 [Desulfarculus sp.]|nr:hypothetical protein [Desulfarculus sp.]